jgi:argininosuccinate synthase
MGNLVVSVNWRSIPDDHIIRKTLESYAHTHGIPTNMDPNHFQYDSDYDETYGIGYEGLSLLFSRKTYKHKLQQFAHDCDQFLRIMGADYTIRYDDLPM